MRMFSMNTTYWCSKMEVFNVVRDLRKYEQWNTFLSYSKQHGEYNKTFSEKKKEDGKLHVKKCRVERDDEGVEFSLSKTYGHEKIGKEIQLFYFEQIDDKQMRFSYSWEYKGVLWPFIGFVKRKRSEEFQCFCRDLKYRLDKLEVLSRK